MPEADATLDTQFLPAELVTVAERAWASIRERCSPGERAALQAALAERGRGPELARVLACSRFVTETLRRRPWLLEQLLVSGALEHPLREGQLHAELGDALAVSGEKLDVVLRRFRQRHLLRIIWRDLNRLAPTLETTRDVSWLAEACVQRALVSLSGELEDKYNKLKDAFATDDSGDDAPPPPPPAD